MTYTLKYNQLFKKQEQNLTPEQKQKTDKILGFLKIGNFQSAKAKNLNHSNLKRAEID